jgi:hypothetical protein
MRTYATCWLLLLGAAPSIATNAQELMPLVPLDSSGRITYFVAEGIQRSQYRASDRELAVWALQAWARASDGKLHFDPAAEEDALLRVYFVPANEGHYVEIRAILVNGRRGSAVFIRPDTNALGPAIATLTESDPLWRDTIVYLTCLHETGHALGLVHTDQFADIMYSFQFGGDIPAYFGRYRDGLESRDDIANVSGVSVGDLEQMRALYLPPQ